MLILRPLLRSSKIHARSQKFSRKQYDNAWEMLLFMSCVDSDDGFTFLTVCAWSANKCHCKYDN